MSMIYRRNSKSLELGFQSYTAISGPHGQGKLPRGSYTVKTRNVVDGKNSPLDPAYTAGGVGFFIPIEYDGLSNRHGFGIHPDGNIFGTLGCIGICADDAKNFWKAWLGLSLGSRPTRLLVID